MLIRYGESEWEWGRRDWLVTCCQNGGDWFAGILGVRLGIAIGAERRHQGRGMGIMVLLTFIGEPWRDLVVSLW